MSPVPKCRSALADAAILLFLCQLLFAACSGSGPGGDLQFQPVEANVWCDSMPGAPPRTVAVMNGMLKNGMRDTLVIRTAEGFVVAPRTGFAIRKFPCRMTGAGGEIRRLLLLPGDSIAVTLRTPELPVAPFDLRTYPQVRFVVQLQTEDGRRFPVRSGILRPFATQ